MLTSAEKSARYRAKDIEGYRAKKNALAKTEKHKLTRKLYMQQWRDKNKEKYNKMANASHKKNKFKHIDRDRNWHLKNKYNISLDQFNEMVKIQNNKCLICRNEFNNNRTTQKWHVDHDHKTGIVRGILCGTCNARLGWYENNKFFIEQYLQLEDSFYEDYVW